jgi:hypothetical protein
LAVWSQWNQAISDRSRVKRGVGLPQRRLRGRRRVLPGILALAAAGLVATIGTGEVGAAGAPASDFNGDGRGDLVLGVAGEDILGQIDAGQVTVVYGDASGVNLDDSASISQAGAIAGTAQSGDQFGRSFATGDFNDDGYSDLVVGAPNEAVAGIQAAGGITVIYGSMNGLTPTGSTAFSQGGSIAGNAETGDRFGGSVAAGDPEPSPSSRHRA